MSLFSRILPKKQHEPSPQIQFGRFCDGYKSPAQIICWDLAVKHFVAEKYLDSFESLLGFLKDSASHNVVWTKSSGVIQFTLYQGSKLVSGEVSALHVWAKARIAGFESPDVGWMRILLEENYHMLYSRYAVNDQNEIIIVFDNFMEEASPHKMLEALRELAIRADKLDDILIADFSYLKPLQNQHIIPLSDHIKETKYRFFAEKVREVRALINHPPQEFLSYKASYMYLILATGYSLDYLIKPEGKLMKCIEQCHTQYFNEMAMDPDIKIRLLIQNFSKMDEMDKSAFLSEMYETRSTFGMDLPVGSRGLLEVIEAQWSDLEWFYENEYHVVHKYMCDYIIGFSLFSMSLPLPYKKLLHLYYEVTEYPYFKALGFECPFIKEDKIVVRQMGKTLQHIKTNENPDSMVFSPDVSLLDGTTQVTFRHSFLFMLKETLSKE